jgi:hypothetical protein
MQLLSTTPNMLPEELLRNVTSNTTTILRRSTGDAAPPVRWWSVTALATVGAMLGSTLLV